MKARLFDGTELVLSRQDIDSIEIEDDDYSILIRFSELYSQETGYKVERADLIQI